MPSDTTTESTNDSGIVIVLALMMAAIAYALFSSVSLYAAASATDEPKHVRRMRLLSASANTGNAVTHVLLILYLFVENSENAARFFVKERNAGVGALVFLVVVNLMVGISSFCSRGRISMWFSLGWNSFAIVMGTFIPDVWQRFFNEGLATWPYINIFFWFAIFAMELTAVCTSATRCALMNLEARHGLLEHSHSSDD